MGNSPEDYKGCHNRNTTIYISFFMNLAILQYLIRVNISAASFAAYTNCD
jgi:hypothetical protein